MPSHCFVPRGQTMGVSAQSSFPPRTTKFCLHFSFSYRRSTSLSSFKKPLFCRCHLLLSFSAYFSCIERASPRLLHTHLSTTKSCNEGDVRHLSRARNDRVWMQIEGGWGGQFWASTFCLSLQACSLYLLCWLRSHWWIENVEGAYVRTFDAFMAFWCRLSRAFRTLSKLVLKVGRPRFLFG